MARRKKYVGEYSDEDLAGLKPGYRARVISYRRRVGPFGLIKDARGKGVPASANVERARPPSVAPAYIQPQYTEGKITKPKAQALYYQWIVRTTHVPKDIPIYDTVTDPKTGITAQKSMPRGLPIATPDMNPTTIARILGGVNAPDSDLTYQQAFEELWDRAARADKNRGGTNYVGSLAGLFFSNAQAATAYRNKDTGKLAALNRVADPSIQYAISFSDQAPRVNSGTREPTITTETDPDTGELVVSDGEEREYTDTGEFFNAFYEDTGNMDEDDLLYTLTANDYTFLGYYH
jgi:hypothetical protein